MKRRYAILTIVLALIATPCFSQNFSVFGPKTYHKNKGAPVNYTEVFAIPPGVEDFQLIIKNGTDEGGAVKNLSVTLNDIELVSSKDLKETGTAVKDVHFLHENNRLSVTLRGPGDNAVSVHLVGNKTEVPGPMPPMPPIDGSGPPPRPPLY